jgi:8-oxo-dGTP pyrophosphatase MutT (NUDIX family)
LADGFLALPGGAGTLEELFEVWTWAQLGLHDKPIGLVDVDGFYQPLLTMVEHMVDAGFLRPSYRDMVAVNADPAVLLDGFVEYRAPDSKWGLARNTGDEQPIDVLAWIIVRDGKLLNVRTKGKAHFYLPGGKREPGESDPNGLVREIAEELGVRIDPASMRLFDLIQDKADGWADGRLVRMACYWADHDGELVPGGEIAELAWIGLADADKLAPAGLQVLQMLAGQGLIR